MRLHLLLVAGSLVCLGLGLFLYKAFILGFPLFADRETTVWHVEAQVEFVAKGKPAKVSLMVPQNNRRYVVMDESFISQGFGLSTTAVATNRQAVWSVRKASGKQTLFYRAAIRRVEKAAGAIDNTPPTVTPYVFEGAMSAAADAIIAGARGRSADTESFIGEIVRDIEHGSTNESVRLLIGKRATALKKMQLAVQLLSRAAIPARVVRGVRLENQGRHMSLVPWIEAYDEGKWRSFDPLTGGRGIASEYFAWWYGDEVMASIKGGEELKTIVSVEAQQISAIEAAEGGGARRDPVLALSLFDLPVATQLVYRILLLVPLGAALVVVLRNVVGVVTFGTFMPVLVALAFRETRLLTGLILFTILVAVGLSVRFYLERLKLLLVPRLGAVLIVVVLLMVATSLVLHRFDIDHGLSVALFPMVILTMTIERMSIVWEELGGAAAVRQGIGTLAVAILIYLVITFQPLEHLIFVFPELLLVVLAGTLLVGRYTGYRLLELRRFRVLAGE